ncbi:MAG TPA: RNA polymerase sigma factor [Streptosporangiaceae bacterium]|nr:RNA polymerase sigma factor [Streptosporangiaceae bacterium]
MAVQTDEPATGACPAGSTAPTRDTCSADGADFGGVVERAQRGDPEAFRVLYRDIQPRLLRYLHALAGQDAEDIAAETWLQITRDLPAFTGDYDHFRGWTATIARHRALDHLRATARRPPQTTIPADDLAARPAADDTAQSAIDALATDAALALIATLPPDQAEAVLLRAVLGLDARTAAQVLGKRPGAVRTAAYRGLRTLERHPAVTSERPAHPGPAPGRHK